LIPFFYWIKRRLKVRTGGFRRVSLLILVIVLLLTSATLPIFNWVSLTSASSEAQIWTEDAEGNIRTDFEPDETVYIHGSGFIPNAQIEITVTRPDNTVDQGSILSDDNGNFVYAYLLDGIYGTYYVTATDGVNSASTTFDDRPKLQGLDWTTGGWTSGLLSGWKELEWVPYRIRFKNLPEGTSSYTFNVYHNNLDNNKDGVDRLRDFRVGDENGNPVNGTIIAEGPFYKTPGKGSDRDIYYALSVSFTTPFPKLTWYVYWQAHLALGASGWPGASLHTYTDISGKQDVPINVPPAPTGSISGSKWGDSDIDGLWDPGENGLPGWTIQLYFFDPVENAWTHLADENTDDVGGYTFSGLVGADYYLAEILQENWVQTYPPSGIHSLTLSEGENRIDLDFGNFLVTRGVEVSILPSYQSAPPGSTLTYSVVVKNVGDVTDSYTLTATDNAGWLGPWTQELIDIPPGENRTKLLNVFIPEIAVPSTEDNIVVRVTSQADNRVSAENSAIAHVAAFVRAVAVSLAPKYQENLPGATVTYTVTVRNEGDVEDNFILIANDNENWGTMISPPSVALPPDSSDNATLSLTIPENALGNKEATVVVTATSAENTEVSASDNGIVKISVVRDVEVSISPDYQGGTPEMTLIYTVTITNTGNVEDTYNITVSDNAGWDPEFDLAQVKLAPYGSAVIWYLGVIVPEYVPFGAEDNITITATSTDNEVSDSGSCIAQRSKAEFSLVTFYKVGLDVDFYFGMGSDLIVKFYTYGGVYQAENVVWSGSTPDNVNFSKIVSHPMGKVVEHVRLVLIDETGAEIATVVSFTVTKNGLFGRIMEIKGLWPFASPDEQDALFQEIMDIKGVWPFAPS
jgi:hypothetical protein